MTTPFTQLQDALPLLNDQELQQLAQEVSDKLTERGILQTDLQQQTKPSNGGGRKGRGKLPFWLKHVTGFDSNKKSAYAFEGELIWPTKVHTLGDGTLILFGTGKGSEANYALLKVETGVTTDVYGYTLSDVRVLKTSDASRWMPNELQQLHGKPIAPIWTEAQSRLE